MLQGNFLLIGSVRGAVNSDNILTHPDSGGNYRDYLRSGNVDILEVEQKQQSMRNRTPSYEKYHRQKKLSEERQSSQTRSKLSVERNHDLN